MLSMKNLIRESLNTIENVCKKYDLRTLSDKISQLQIEL